MARAAANRGRLGDPTRCPVGRDADSVQRGREGEKAGETAKVREKKKRGGLGDRTCDGVFHGRAAAYVRTSSLVVIV